MMRYRLPTGKECARIVLNSDKERVEAVSLDCIR